MNEQDFKALKPGQLVKCTDSDPAYEGHFAVGETKEVAIMDGWSMYLVSAPGHNCKATHGFANYYTGKYCGPWSSNTKWVRSFDLPCVATAEEAKNAPSLPGYDKLDELFK